MFEAEREGGKQTAEAALTRTQSSGYSPVSDSKRKPVSLVKGGLMRVFKKLRQLERKEEGWLVFSTSCI